MNRGKFLYREEKLEGGWSIIHVLEGGVVRGRITRDAKRGKYRYFPGADNNVSFDLEHAELLALKQLIEARHLPDRL